MIQSKIEELTDKAKQLEVGIDSAKNYGNYDMEMIRAQDLIKVQGELQQYKNLDELRVQRTKIFENSKQLRRKKKEIGDSDKQYLETVESIVKNINKEYGIDMMPFEKKNRIQVFLSGIVNKFNGQKKFDNFVKKPLENKLKEFSENVAPKITSKAKETIKTIGESKQVQKVTQIIREASIKKNKIVSKMMVNMQEKTNKNIEKINAYNKNHPNKTIGRVQQNKKDKPEITRNDKDERNGYGGLSLYN